MRIACRDSIIISDGTLIYGTVRIYYGSYLKNAQKVPMITARLHAFLTPKYAFCDLY